MKGDVDGWEKREERWLFMCLIYGRVSECEREKERERERGGDCETRVRVSSSNGHQGSALLREL